MTEGEQERQKGSRNDRRGTGTTEREQERQRESRNDRERAGMTASDCRSLFSCQYPSCHPRLLPSCHPRPPPSVILDVSNRGSSVVAFCICSRRIPGLPSALPAVVVAASNAAFFRASRSRRILGQSPGHASCGSEKTGRRQRHQRAFRATSWNNHSERSENVTNDRVGAVEEFAERRE